MPTDDKSRELAPVGHDKDSGLYSERNGKPPKEDKQKMAAIQLPC